MIMKIKDYISSADSTVLKLSMSGIALGAMLAAADFHVNWFAVLFLASAVLCFQLFSTIIPGVLCAFAAVYFSYGTLFLLDSFILLLLVYLVYRFVNHHSTQGGLFRHGIVKTLSTLMIYGVIPVFGTYYVCTHSFGSYLLFLPAVAVGSLCLASINAECLYDRKDLVFQTIWTAIGLLAMAAYSCLRIFDIWHFLFVLTLPLYAWQLAVLWKKGSDVSEYASRLSWTVLVFSVLSGLGFMIYLF